MKYYFPIHLDSGNRGCEGIAKGTAILLQTNAANNIGLCRDIKLDTLFEVNNYISLFPTNTLTWIQKIKRSLEVHLTRNIEKRVQILQKYDYINFFANISDADIMISTGGDMMCYTNNQVNYTNNLMHLNGISTILWGCSMGPENLTPEKEETLRNFSLLYARESLTYDFFKSLGLKNVCLYPDPAFILNPQECKLPQCFENSDVIGINLSNYVLGDFSLDKPFGQEVKRMFDYIVNETDLHILLIPHVTWEDQDDRRIAKLVCQLYESTNRVSILDIDKLNYLQIRNVISKCKFFIGGRTHAVISAYSMCVPAIALGYSIKSRGIAKDLGLSEILVVDSKNVVKGQLLESLKYMIDHRDAIKAHMDETIPSYRERTYGIRNELENLKTNA